MGEIININDHIDKSQSKKRYLSYEKVKVLEETIKSFIDEIPDLPRESYIHYFIKIVKKQIPIFDNKFFDCKYIWASKYLKYEIVKIKQSIAMYMLLHKNNQNLLISMSFLMHLTIFFQDEVENFCKIVPHEFEDIGLKFFKRSIKYKKYIDSFKLKKN